MKERPIIFSAPMVREILEGRKTMTRRVVKFPEWKEKEDSFTCKSATVYKNFDVSGHNWFTWDLNGVGGWNSKEETIEKSKMCSYIAAIQQDFVSCPYGQPGDRLWVKEKWRVGAWDVDTGNIAVDYAASPELAKTPWIYADKMFERLWIQSTDDAMKANLPMDECGEYHWEPGKGPCHWRSSMFMPRWASRITLEITAVRVERLHDISTSDVFAEGMEMRPEDDDGSTWGAFGAAHQRFKELWESINGPDSWDVNPWVWVIEFKRVEA